MIDVPAVEHVDPFSAAYAWVHRHLWMLGWWLGGRAVVFAAAAASSRSFGALHAWDARWYRIVASKGYLLVPGRQSDPAFFPLYPVLLRVVHAIGVGYATAGVGGDRRPAALQRLVHVDRPLRAHCSSHLLGPRVARSQSHGRPQPVGRLGRAPRRRNRHHPSRVPVASSTVPTATVCLPTYNERANIEPMLRALAPLGVNVLVVDDNSPDGTGEIADRLAAELGFVSVLHRELKEGLGPAYIAGFHRALDDGADLVLEMDCDFSHDPADVPKLIAACEEADLAIGSRYVPGGGTENWGRGRRFVSTGGSWYARTILGVGIRDLTGGFKCYRRTVLETIDLASTRSKG
jgi:dolichol-phosphate mannosyltransferase